MTVTIKVDAAGNKKLVGFEKLYDWDSINDYLEVDDWSISDDGVLTVHVSDSRHTKGRTATITLVIGSWNDSVSIVWGD